MTLPSPVFPATQTDPFEDEALPAVRSADIAHDALILAAGYARKARSENTRKAYRKAWACYARWCAYVALPVLSGDPHHVAMYLAAAAEGRVPDSDPLSVSTIRQHLSAIVAAHRAKHIPIDVKAGPIAAVMAGIARQKGQQQRRVAPVLGDWLKGIMKNTPDTPRGRRDRALLLIGFGGALRRGEITALDLADIEIVEGKGLKVMIRKSKGDQFGEGEEVAIYRASDVAICSVETFRSWLAVRGPEPGPLFVNVRKNGQPGMNRLSDYDVVRIIKAAVGRLGLDTKLYSGHSLRAGLATTAGLLDMPLTAIMVQTRHKSVQVAKRYVRNAEIWKQNVTEKIFTVTDVALEKETR